MNIKQKLFYAVAGFFIGNIIFASLIFGISSISNYQSSKNDISFDEALQRIKSKEINEVVIKGDKAKFLNKEGEKYSADISENEKERIFANIGEGVKLNLLPNSTSSLDKLFQILFILLIISPPLMVVMLYLIWKELKARNKMK